MKILITGGNGSIGKSTIDLLLKKGNNITTLGSSQIEGCSFIHCDFSKDWDSSILPKDIEVIIHLAQSSKFRDFPDSALEVFNVNTMSTLKLANYAREIGVKNFIYASSGGVYGNRDKGFTEDEVLSISDLGFYLGTKLNSEILLDSYKNYFNPILLRFFFVYGPDQSKDMLIPRLIENVKLGNEINIAKDGGIKINPIYVTDAAEVILESLKIKNAQKLNVGGSEVMSLKDICDTIGDLVNKQPCYNIVGDESNHLIGDVSKITATIFQPKVKLIEGLSKMI